MAARKIIIVGSGVAGATVAQQLLLRNPKQDITMLEAGPSVEMRNRRRWQDFVTSGVLPYANCQDIETEYESRVEQVELREARLFVRGGSTVHWGGWALRFKPEDFVLKTNAGRELDWPIGYDELEPYYFEAERLLGVAGDSNDDNPPRRGKRYPFEPVPFCEPDGIAIKVFQYRNYHFAHLPIARYGDRCLTTGTCKYCPVGGRYSADMTLDELASYPNFELRLNCAVRKILLQNKRQAAAVEYVDTTTGDTGRLDGEIICLCNGAVEAPKLLLASRNIYWPDGVGNDAGHVGRHFKLHQLLVAEGVLPTNPKRMQQELDFPTLCSRQFDTPAEQVNGKFFFVRGTSGPDQKIEALIQTGLSAQAIDERTRGPMTLALNGFVEQFAPAANLISLADGTNRFGLPRTSIEYSLDPVFTKAVRVNLARMDDLLLEMGAIRTKSKAVTARADHAGATCRMSGDEKDGVVTASLAVHGMDNVFVCSNAVFPNIAAVNPTLTLVALAVRLVDQELARG